MREGDNTPRIQRRISSRRSRESTVQYAEEIRDASRSRSLMRSENLSRSFRGQSAEAVGVQRTMSRRNKEATENGEPTTVGQNTQQSQQNATDKTQTRITQDTVEHKDSLLPNEFEENTEGDIRLLNLCKKSQWGKVDVLLRAMEPRSAEINYFQSLGITPLMLACKENKVIIAEKMIDLGAKVDHVDKEGLSALHYAAKYAKEDIVRMLINKKANSNIAGGPENQLPLHIACARGINAFNIVQSLLKSSSDRARFTADKHGNIPLFVAAQSGTIATCRELLMENAKAQTSWASSVNGDSVLHIACRKSDFDLAKIFVEAGAPVNTQNLDGVTPLHISAALGDESIVSYLYSAQADPNIIDKHDQSALHVAAEKGHTTVVDLLVDKAKADPHARTKDGSTLIHVASSAGHPATALALLKKGVPLMMPNKNGAICLHTAAQRGHVSVVQALLAKGAAVDAKTKDNYTALHIAVEACKPLVIQTLLGYGAQVELKGGKAEETPLHIASRVPGADKCVEMLIKCGADVNNRKENGETALHIAAKAGHLRVAKYLVEEGADPILPSRVGETPLHIAVQNCHLSVCEMILRFVAESNFENQASLLVNSQNSEGESCVHYAAKLVHSQSHSNLEDRNIIKLLMLHNGDTSLKTYTTWETPLHYCARAGNSSILMEMLKHMDSVQIQLSVNKQAKNGWSPLLIAGKEGHIEIVKILLNHQARVDVFDEYGKAALHLAAENGHQAVADLLLSYKAFVNAKSKIGLTPTHLAAKNGYNDLINLLVGTYGALVDALSLAKRTPLHMAAETGQMVVCDTLLRMGANVEATDEHGQTALHLAAENDHSDVIKLFLRHDSNLVTMADTNGMTYAHIAASKGSVGVIKELMKFDKELICNAKIRTSLATSLHLAAEGGHKDVVEALLDAGANPLEENAEGMTALHLAARYGYVEILDVLKDHLELNTSSSKSGFTALHVAAHYGQTTAVRELLNKVSATVHSYSTKTPVNIPHPGEGLSDGIINLPVKTNPKSNRFKRAATKAINQLVVTENHGLTPLHLAAQSGHENLVRVLLNSPGVKVDVPTTVHGSIPLHLAAQNGHTGVVSLLLSRSTDLVHVKDKRGRTGLHLAANNGQFEMVALLLGQGAEINACDNNGWTALHYSAKTGHLSVVKLLCDSGASTLVETKENKTAVCFAASSCHCEVLSFLLHKKHNTHDLMDDKKFIFDLMICGKTNDQRSIEEFVNLSLAPCETAAKMSKNFANVATQEKERSKDLNTASDFCQQMATELMAIAASTNSPALLLKAVDSRGIQFLDVLIECNQKEVVAHPTIQKYLSDIWMGGIQWKNWKILMLFFVFMICPPVWVAFSLPLKHRYNRVPIFKFMSYLVSHCLLVVLLVLTVVVPSKRIYESADLFPNVFECLLLAWLSGMLVSELTKSGSRTGLEWIKLVIVALCAVAVLVHITGFAYGRDADERLTCIYLRNQLLAFALLLCFVFSLDFLTFHNLFGPWTIIISSLIMDTVRFLVILVAFMLGFTFQVSAIYQPVYRPSSNPLLGDGDGGAGARYLSVVEVFELLFFSLFGLVDPPNLPPLKYTPAWSQTVVKVVFGIYMLIALIVLINLLIAMMSDTYQRIQAQSDTEWKFGRAKLIRNMNKTSSTPAPINLFAKLFTYTKAFIKYRGRLCTAEGRELINEEEGLSNNFVIDPELEQSHVAQAWLKSVRGTQISPESEKDRRQPVRLERSIDWKNVVNEYYINKGVTDREKLSEENEAGKDDQVFIYG